MKKKKNVLKKRRRNIKKWYYDLRLIILFIILFLLVLSLFTLTKRFKMSNEEDNNLPSVGIFGEIDSSLFGYVDYTPINGSVIGNNHIEIGFNINKDNINYFKYYFNGTNYSIYDDSLILMMNLDEVSSLGEDKLNVKDVSILSNNGLIRSGMNKENDGDSFFQYGENSEFDNKCISNPSVILRNGVYHMWYSGKDRINKETIGYAISSDGVNWNKQNNGNPVLGVGESNKFDFSGVNNPSVIINNGIYNMWYVGYYNSIKKIGHATSVNGINWTRMNDGDPILELGGSGKFDDIYTDSPSVLFKDNMFHMWYNGNDGFGYATSNDGVNWNKMNNGDAVFVKSISLYFDIFNIDHPDVRFFNDQFNMFYTGYSNEPSVAGIGIAKSDDGINWVRENNNPLISGSRDINKFDYLNVYSSSTLVNDDGDGNHEYINLYYTGSDGNNCNIGLLKDKNIYSDGKYGKSLSLNGKTDFITVPNRPEYDFTNYLSISAWIKPMPPELYDNVIFSKYDYNLDKGWMFSLTDYGPGPYLLMTFGKNSYFGKSTENITKYNEWVHVTAVNSLNEPIRLYVNGKEIINYTIQNTLGNIDPFENNLEIGRRTDSLNRKFKGNMDNLKIWNKVLSSDEVMIDYLSNLNKYETSGWNFYINQTKLNGEILDYGTYLINGYLEDSVETKYEAGERLITLKEEAVIINTPIDPGTGGDGSGNNGGGGIITTKGNFFTRTFFVNESNIIIGYKQDLKEKQNLIFTRYRKNNTLGILDINNNNVMINLSFKSGNVVLKEGEMIKYNLNDDEFYDLSIKLNSINLNSVEFELTGIYEDISKTNDKTTVDEDKKKPKIVFPYIGDQKINNWIFYIIIGTIILGIIFIFLLIIREFKKKVEDSVIKR